MQSELPVAGLAEVAELLGVSKRTASRYTLRPDFPAPAVVLAMGPIWYRAEVEEWVANEPVQCGRPPTTKNRST